MLNENRGCMREAGKGTFPTFLTPQTHFYGDVFSRVPPLSHDLKKGVAQHLAAVIGFLIVVTHARTQTHTQIHKESNEPLNKDNKILGALDYR